MPTALFAKRPFFLFRSSGSDFPVLQIASIGSNAVVSWPTNRSGFVAQYSTNLSNPNGWVNIEGGSIVVDGHYVVTNQIDLESKFYRLKR